VEARPELGDLDRRQGRGFDEVFEARFAGPDLAVNEQRLVATLAEAAIEEHDVTSGSADVEAGDHPHNLQRAGRGVRSCRQ
jgi:hypothetical protein